MKLSSLSAGQKIKNLITNQIVDIVAVKIIGDDVAEITYKDERGNLSNYILDSDQAEEMKLLGIDAQWRFNSDTEIFRLASEAYRINSAYLFENYLAVRSSLIEPLPHQISAVYEKMLVRQPLRFVLADDPGAGKTIMTGLLIKELIIRGDVQRCLIVCPGTLVEQWQDELRRKFRLNFDVLTSERIKTAASGNVFGEVNFCIAGIDRLARNEDIQEMLKATDWDLIVCDEAHKMSATIQGNEIRRTKRFKLGEALRQITRHFLLLTATPHNGKDADFYLFMSLIDPDRFEGAKRIPNPVDVSDIMRRLVKEDLLTFEEKKLFPERRAYTVNYGLSQQETELYNSVTDYVADGFNRAERLKGNKKTSVGFAMTILQRRLASSPQAIYRSLERRSDRLQNDLRKKTFLQATDMSSEIFDDCEEYPSGESERLENELSERETSSLTKEELRREIETLRQLTDTAKKVFFSGEDRKWQELAELLQTPEFFSKSNGERKKLIIFTEHRDTLEYLQEKISSLFGRIESVVTIHGGMNYRERHKVEEQFRQDKNVVVLVATDAAGEGINLQNAHLMINYDLPWNPNRLEQRFGRIHRIGQRKICHLWNLVAIDTREGQVFRRLLEKLSNERTTLGGKVFDILGKISFDNKPLRELLIEAIRYGNNPKVIRRLDSVVDKSFDTDKLKELLRERALTEDVMNLEKIADINQSMARGEVHRLQPYVVEKFFVEAFKQFGGQILWRGSGRYEIPRVPVALRDKTLQNCFGESVATQYKRICFDKKNCQIPGIDSAELVTFGHPLLNAVTTLTLRKYGYALREGTIFIDNIAGDKKIRQLFCIEIEIRDGRQVTVSKRLRFVEVSEDGQTTLPKFVPYLDFRAPNENEREEILSARKNMKWLTNNVEATAINFAVKNLALPYRREIEESRKIYLNKLQREVEGRLKSEINFWDGRAAELQSKDKLNAEKADRRADEFAIRLKRRLDEITRERQIFVSPPRVISSALIVPQGWFSTSPEKIFSTDAESRAHVEQIAMQAVMKIERELGNTPVDVSNDKCGYDIESSTPNGQRRLIEVKGRHADADTITVTKNEILTALNSPENFILAIVSVDDNNAHVTYLKTPFVSPPDFTAVSINCKISLIKRQGKIILERNISVC
ncbi:MAG: DUF3883 domain-containing protein [Selenomonadaceae bacterium]|nr:DUF3883 domain-containing protein [Selenomonadaceae bacterium]